MEKYIDLIKEYSKKTYTDMTRKPEGILKYPFIVPGSSSYNNCLWDWDSWLTDIAVRNIMEENQDFNSEFMECEKGCILNFLNHMQPDGRIPVVITPEKTMPDFSENIETNIHKPCLAQHAAFVCAENNDDGSWLRAHIRNLKQFVAYYMNNCRHEQTGLYFWIDDFAIGVDNDPCTYFRPKKSSASVFLNCLMYKELLSMTYLCDILGEDGTFYREQAEKLRDAVQEHLWDERNGMFYSADLNLLPVTNDGGLHSGMPRHWSCLIQRIDVWSGFMAMWAGIATSEQAKRMVYENMNNENTFNAEYGIRTLAKTEKMYCTVKSGNPSCWLGPIWIISNYMCFRGLADYGFDDEARALAEKTIKLLGKDIESCGEMHEYYHPDTGVGINNPGFQNWNLLVNNMICYLREKAE